LALEHGSDGSVILSDLGSTNGTWIGPDRITRATKLIAGAVFSAGDSDFFVIDEELIPGAVEDGKLSGGPADEPTLTHERAHGAVPPRAPTKARPKMSPHTMQLVLGGAGAGLVVCFLLSMALWLANAEVSRPIASLACSEGTTISFGTEDYAYRSEVGVEIAYACCGPGGQRCEDVSTTVLFYLNVVLLFPLSFVGIMLFLGGGALVRRIPWAGRAILWSALLLAVIATAWLVLAGR